MAESASIQKMSHKHEEILNFLLANPLLKMGDVAAHFNVTFPWLSTIVHSHAFQDQLQRRQDQVFDSAVLAPIEGKLSAAAQVTLDAYLEKVPTLTADQLISSSDKLLKNLGYGSNGRGGGDTVNNTQINIGQVDPNVLKEARDRIGTSQVGAPDSQPALQDHRTNGAAEIEGVVVREESKLRVD